MPEGSSEKIIISREHFDVLAAQESELIELIRAGEATDGARDSLSIIQELLRKAEIKSSGHEGPTPPEAA